MENSERLGQQERPEFKPDTSPLLVWSVTTPPLIGPFPSGKTTKDLSYHYAMTLWTLMQTNRDNPANYRR